MIYNEPDAALRQIPIYLVDSGGSPVTGLTLTGSEVQVSLSGAPFVNGSGTATEVGSGYYYYTATQAETATDSFIILRVNDAAAKTYVISVDIGDRIEQSEPVAAARRLPIYVVDSGGTPVTGLTLNAANIKLSTLGAAFVDATTVPATEIGLGAYYYELTAVEVASIGIHILKVTHASITPYVYAWAVRAPAAALDGECGYFGGYFGLCEGAGTTTTTTTTTSPVESPLTTSDPEFVDLIAQALNRLPEYAKRKGPA